MHTGQVFFDLVAEVLKACDPHAGAGEELAVVALGSHAGQPTLPAE